MPAKLPPLERMLVKIGAAMMLLAITFAAVVAVVVNLSGGTEYSSPVASAEPQAAETPGSDRKPNAGSKPQIKDKMQKEQPRSEQPRREKFETSSKKPKTGSNKSEAFRWKARNGPRLTKVNWLGWMSPATSSRFLAP